MFVCHLRLFFSVPHLILLNFLQLGKFLEGFESIKKNSSMWLDMLPTHTLTLCKACKSLRTPEACAQCRRQTIKATPNEVEEEQEDEACWRSHDIFILQRTRYSPKRIRGNWQVFAAQRECRHWATGLLFSFVRNVFGKLKVSSSQRVCVCARKRKWSNFCPARFTLQIYWRVRECPAGSLPTHSPSSNTHSPMRVTLSHCLFIINNKTYFDKLEK